MTKTQAALVAAMKAAIAEGTWAVVNGQTIRFTETVDTPEIHRGTGFGRWPHPTYDRHVFLTVVPRKPWAIIFRETPAPWVGARDSTITFKRAFEILEDPAGVFAV